MVKNRRTFHEPDLVRRFQRRLRGAGTENIQKLDRDVIVTVWDPELVPEMLRRGVSVILGRGGHSAADTQGSGPAGGGDPHPL